MTVTINTAWINQFHSGLYLLESQRTSKFKGIFEEATATGEKHFFDRLGSIDDQEKSSRLTPTPLTDMPHSRRMASVRTYHAAAYLDSLDTIRMGIDPTSAYMMRLAETTGRRYDDVCLEALIGTANTGADGSGTQALPSGQKVAHGSVGLTVDKLIAGVEIFNANEVMGKRKFLAIPASALTDLLNETEVNSHDYNTVRPLVTGELDTFMGFKIILHNRITPITAGSVYRAIAFSEDALKIARPQQMKVEVGKLAERSFADVLYVEHSIGGVRVEDNQVVEIAYQ
jgi:hypothetical protein